MQRSNEVHLNVRARVNVLQEVDKVPEIVEYDHVGIEKYLFNYTMPRTEERIRKGRGAFNNIAGVALRKRVLIWQHAPYSIGQS